MQQGNVRQMTVNDFIHADARVIELKKKYQEAQNNKNQKVLDISNVEAGIIAKMGAFEYLNGFTDIEEAQKELLPDFRHLLTKKHILIEAIRDEERTMEELTKTFDETAKVIVKELQEKFQSGSAPESGESAPESAPDDCCGDCGNCECHKEE